MQYLFVILFLTTAAVDLFLAVWCYKHPGERRKVLGHCLIAALSTSITYLMSVLAPTKFSMSLMSSLYFCSTDLLVLNLLFYSCLLSGTNVRYTRRLDCRIVLAYTAFDIIMMMVNPFREIAMGYTYDADAIAHWRYAPHLLHHLHMAYTYLVVAYILFLIIRRTLQVPAIYRKQYYNTMIGLMIIIVANAVFVFIPNNDFIDFSILLYSVLGAFYCWTENDYSRHVILTRAQNAILENMERPLILFDYEDRFVICNKDMEALLPQLSRRTEEYFLKDLVADLDMPQDILEAASGRTFRWKQNLNQLYRCDYRLLYGRKDQVIGKLFLFTDASLEVDLITEFPNKITMEQYFKETCYAPEYPAATIVIDLNQLAMLNREAGEATGDAAIRQLADLMRKHCPKDSYFARLEDANLMAICPDTDTFHARTITEAINQDLSQCKEYPFVLETQSAVCITSAVHPDLIESVTNAMATLKTKKMLDSTSAHASLLSSLAQAQNESDPATEDHVQRTRLLGDMLGRRMGLSDQMLNDLSLLCLLHDIGKLGVPLEILNKPGALTKEEWDVMRSHVEKGYNIAMVSKELRGIADLILHHHECWDGSGYPDHLRQEAIPLLSRIIAVVDTYDAMTNDRPYRKGIPIEVAVQELKRCAGAQFDPNVVSEFIDLLREMYPYMEESSEQVQVLAEEQLPAGAFRRKSGTGSASDQIHIVDNVRIKIDGDLKILEVNEAFTAMSGYSVSDIEHYQLNLNDLILTEEQEAIQQLISDQMSSNQMVYLEHRIRRKDGSLRDVLTYGRLYYDPVVRNMRGELIIVDIASIATLQRIVTEERNSANRSLQRWELLMRRDSLTGLLNHGAFYADAAARLLREDKRSMLLVMDIDDFKKCNDTLGHQAGDELLKVLSHELQHAAEPEGICGRVGGDEFAAILSFPPDISEKAMYDRAEEIRRQIIKSMNDTWTVSMGAVSTRKKVRTIAELYKIADTALYTSKNQGKNQLHCVFQ